MGDTDYLIALFRAGSRISPLPIKLGVQTDQLPITDPPKYLLMVSKTLYHPDFLCFEFGRGCEKIINSKDPDIIGSSNELKDAFDFFVKAIFRETYSVHLDTSEFKNLNAVEALERLEEIAANQ